METPEPPPQSGFEATIAIASAEGLALSAGHEGPVRGASPGSRVARYLILEELGRGGMGVVYAAYDPQLDRRVAIKVISVDAFSGRGEAEAEAQSRLLREAQAMARLLHPNVVAVHDVGQSERDVYIAMEMVVGQTLRGWLAEAPRGVDAILAVFQAAGRGLEAAHAAGLVHRDFKPDNVLLDRGGAVKIADFGLARRAEALAPAERAPTLDLGDAPADGALTRTGTILGTPAYMAPEQHLSLAADARSDQYSFCVALFEALYGHRPFHAASMAELREQVLRGVVDPPRRADVPRWILPILIRGLAPAPDARWPSMAALLDRLARDPRRTRRRWLIAGGLAATIAAAAITGAQVRAARVEAALTECRAPEAHTAELAGPARMEAIQRAVRATGAPHAERGLEMIRTAIDGFVGRWTELHAASCDASLVRRTLAPEIMALRERCAEQQRRRAAAIVDLLEKADITVVEHLGQLADRLPRPERCDDLRYLVEQVGGDAQAAVNPRIEAIRDELTRAYAEANGGRYQEAIDRVMPLLPEAEALGDRRLLAELRETTGRLLSDMGALDEGEVHLLRGLGDALASDFVVAGAELANQLMYLDGVLRGRAAEGRRWGYVAEGLIDRVDDDDLRLQHLNYLGALYAQSNEYEAGLVVYDEAIEIAERLGIERQDRASLLNNRGILLTYVGRRDEAIASHRQALAILHALVGEDHPDVALTLNGLGLVAQLGGDLDEAIARYREALALLERLLGPESPVLALALINLGSSALEAGRVDEARSYGARVHALVEASYPPDHVYAGYTTTLIGDLALRADHEPATAAARCGRGLEILEANLGADHSQLAYPLICLGEAALARGDAAAARPLLERAMRVQGEAFDVSIGDRGHVRYALARALAALGEGEAARALAAEAIERYRAAGPSYTGRGGEIERWLAGRGAP